MDLRARIRPWSARLLVLACAVAAPAAVATAPAAGAITYQAQWGELGAGPGNLNQPTGVDVGQLLPFQIGCYGLPCQCQQRVTFLAAQRILRVGLIPV